MKYSFKNDYSEGCHPKILEELMKTNMHQQAGYGLDDYCTEAASLIKTLFKAPNSAVHFVSGGTQANLIVISSFLRAHESVVSASTGHIFTNEAAAIEATGHKIHSIETTTGKIQPNDIQKIIDEHQNIPHQVKQKLVYISNSTELGTLYSKEELMNLFSFCQEKKLYLFIDGARLAQALTSEKNDVLPEDLPNLCDAFYLGGTKNGALLGEAIIINNHNLQEEFGYHMKQKGAMLAKGRLLGLQFSALLKDNLYFDLAKHANQGAMKIKRALQNKQIQFLTETFTNQIFPVLTYEQIDQLSQEFDFYIWKKINDDQAAVRLITSWATPLEMIDQCIASIEKLS